MCIQDTGFNRLLKWVRLCIITAELVPPWKKKSGHYSWMNSSPLPWHLLSVQTSLNFIIHWQGSEVNSRGDRWGRENHSPPGKKTSDIQFSTWFISVKPKLIVCHYWAGSCLADVSKPPHFDLARRINTTLYCFNLRGIDFPMLTLYGGTFIIRQA